MFRIPFLLMALVLTGCGSPPTPAVVDAAAEKEDEQQIKAAGKTERKAAPKGKSKPTRNKDDED